MDEIKFRAHIRSALDALAQCNQTIEFWWRDDDAIAASPALIRLLDLTVERPLALAIIPSNVETSLASLLRNLPSEIRVLQHGFAHLNHETPPAKKMELGSARTLQVVANELNTGRSKLVMHFGERFLGVLVPPWNRIRYDLVEILPSLGYQGFSTYGKTLTSQPKQINTHIDPIAWKSGGGFIGWDAAAKQILEAIAVSKSQNSQPIGILTHHLVHDEETWHFCEVITGILSHSAVIWPDIEQLFE